VTVGACLGLTQTAKAAEVLVNGSFESGDFSGWNLDNPGSDNCFTPWQVTATNTVACGVGTITPVGSPIDGTYAAYSAWDGIPSTRTISQTFFVENGVLTGASLAWSESYSWNADPAFNGTLPRTLTVALYDDTNTLIGTVSAESILPGTSGFVDWTAFNIDVQAMLAGQAGRNVTLVFTTVVPELFKGPAVLALDNISLDLQYLCTFGSGDDLCAITSTSPTNVVVDAGAGVDTLQVGGAANFSFDASTIGAAQSYRNFETFQKTGASNITLTGVAAENVDWGVLAGTLTASGGDAIFDTAAVAVSASATFALGASETIGSLSGAGNVSLGANTLTVGGNDLSSTFSGVIGGAGGLVKVGAGTLTLSGANTYAGSTQINAGVLEASGGAALSDTNAVNVGAAGTFRVSGA